MKNPQKTSQSKFQSTPPARGATRRRVCHPIRPAISIHAPREGGDSNCNGMDDLDDAFQSTPPARGATTRARWRLCLRPHFNPRPPRGGRHRRPRVGHVETRISIHAPREGGDLLPRSRTERKPAFQSTPPARGATLRAGRRRLPHRNFNPRPPRGGRPSVDIGEKDAVAISIHAPREGGDRHGGVRRVLGQPISIHAPREGGDTAGVD